MEAVDHFFPLCAGGSNDITNLWFQPEANDNYPIIPHEKAGADCGGCLVPRVSGEEVRLVCNECGAVAATITPEQLEAGYVLEELRFNEVTTAVCPHCGAVQVFPGFNVIDAFICSECGQGLAVEHSMQ
ncbi:MAG TPA: hypothetical protein VIY49_17090 [Bryobacteraceae bacterium]